MLKNYIKIAIRNLWRRKVHSFINVIGLSIGIAAAILISLYAVNELTYDKFHENADDLYLVYKERITPAGMQETYDTWVPMKNELEQTYPVVLRAARMFTGSAWVDAGDKRFQEDVVYTDPQLFEMFSFPLIKGDSRNPFPSLQSVVLSKRMAVKYFGNEDPVGKVMRLAYTRYYTVSGVMDDMPQNSTIQMDMVILLESSPAYENVKEDWGSSFLNTYVQLQEGTSASDLETQFPDFIEKTWDRDTAERTNFKLLPVTEMYNRFNDSNKYAYILLVIAFAIVVIACINYMNMATALSLDRAREVGMRKALGGQRSQLLLQFLGESIFIFLLALLAGITIAELLLPAFNNLYDLNLTLNYLVNPEILVWLTVLGVFVGIAAGVYPALFLSRFSTAEVLRGQTGKKPGGVSLRRALVITQFTVSIVIIIGALIMHRQTAFMKEADLRLQKENIVAIERSAGDFEDSDEAINRLRIFKNEIVNHPDVILSASSRALPGQDSGFNSFTFVRPDGWTDENPLRMRFALSDSYFFELFEINLIEGRNFRADSETDRNEGVIINKAALDDFGWENGAGKIIRLGSGGDQAFTVVGVVENYHYQSLENNVEPVLHFYRPSDNTAHNFISIKLKPERLNETLQHIEAKWNEIVGEEMPINYTFVDEQFELLYQSQDRLTAVAGIFSLFAIIISGLGLFALASLMVSQRTREIGIRKVMGAGVGGIITMLTKDFVLLVLIGFFIAIPVSLIVMSRWLEDFAYRIELGPAVFLLAGLAAVLIALATVSYQSVKAAMMNPVKSLRTE
jgi:putative ABC transport system permease protein